MFNGVIQYKNDKLLQKQIPDRMHYVMANKDGISPQHVVAKIKNKEPIIFLGNDILDTVDQTDTWKYRLIIMGITRCGTKAAVVIGDIIPSFDILIPDGVAPSSFIQILESTFHDNEIRFIKMSLFKAKPSDRFVLHPKSYIKICTFTRNQSRLAILFLQRNDVVYCNKSGELIQVRLELSFDKPWDHYLKYAREHKVNLCGWNQIQKYTMDKSCTVLKGTRNNWSTSVRYVFNVSKKDFLRIEDVDIDPLMPEYSDLFNDKTIVMGWDLETYSRYNTGNVPEPDHVADSNGVLDVIIMASFIFAWTYSDEAIQRICVTDLPCPHRDDTLLIQVKDQEELLKVMANIIEGMSPDYIIGFNDMGYDWPFVHRRLSYYNMENYFKHKLSIVNFTSRNAQYIVQGEYHRDNIKYEAGDMAFVEYFRAPGFICIDAQVTYKQLYPKHPSTSLKSFLALCKLGGKEEMAYMDIFRIYRLWRQIRAEQPHLRLYTDVMDYLCALHDEHGDNYYPYQYVATRPTPGLYDDSYEIDHLNIVKIIQLMGGVEYGGTTGEGITQVIHYCNIDSLRCQELMIFNKVITGKREKGNLSFVSFYETVFKADSMKVRNLLISVGVSDKFKLEFGMQSKPKTDNKYPGAYVVPPKKGLYRDTREVKTCRRLQVEYDSKIEYHELPTNKRVPLDENNTNDAPCSGLDFSSLYPSLIMAYNFSPEMIVTTIEQKQRLESLGYEILYVEFRYGTDKQRICDKQLITGWFVQHRHPVAQKVKHVIKIAKEKFGDDWKTHINMKFIKDCRDKMLNTSIEQWREYGMGLYPYILKQLFDDRNIIKKTMNKFGGPKEIIEKIWKYTKDGNIDMNELSERMDNFINEAIYIHETKPDALTSRNVKYAQSVKAFILDNIKDGALELYTYVAQMYHYYDAKQKALKVYMNTFYGGMGQDTSPFFSVLCAGAVTTYGKKNIMMVKEYVEKLGYSVNYGDTDSLYIVPPHDVFEDLYLDYRNGNITKLDYWTGMVKRTMTAMDELSTDVNNMLMLDNGTLFLRMAYEEVLYPYALLGKKKYIGIKHETVIDFSACNGATLEQFSKSKTLFIKGLELIKRNATQMLIDVSYNVFHRAFDIAATNSFKNIILEVLDIVSTQRWDDSAYIKSSKYKMPKKGKPGNISVLRFADRMNQVHLEQPNLGIKSPEIGDRFEYIVKKRNPNVYDIRGNRSKISKDKGMASKYEYYTSLQNEQYQKLYGSIEIDYDYYMKSIIGQLGRFIIYHPDYDKFFTEDMTDDEYKIADAKAVSAAKLKMNKYYKKTYGAKYYSSGKVNKKIYKAVIVVQDAYMYETLGKASDIMQLSANVNAEFDKDDICDDDIIDKLHSVLLRNIRTMCDKAKVQYTPDLKKILKSMNMDIYDFYLKFVSYTGAYYQKRLTNLKSVQRERSIALRKTLPAFQVVQQKYIEELEDMITLYKQERYGATLEQEIDIDIELDDEIDIDWFYNIMDYTENVQDIDTIMDTFDAYVALHAVTSDIIYITHVIAWCKHLMDKASNGNGKPAFIDQRAGKVDFQKSFREKAMAKLANKKSKLKSRSTRYEVKPTE